MVGDESSSSTKDAGIRHDVSAMKIEIDKHKLTPVNTEKMPESVRTDTPNREETENKKLSKKKRAIECEDIRNDPILKIAEEVLHRKNGVTTDNIVLIEEMKKIIEEGSRALVAGNARLSVSNFQTVIDRLTKPLKDDSKYTWLKYAYFISLIEANNDAELLIALKLLPDLKKTLCASIPVYHYAVAKILIKLNRFRLAEAEIEKCRNSMKEHIFSNQFWPGTNEVIKETNCDGLEEYLQEMTAVCTCYHIPDAICKFGGCLSASTHPFPSREIFHSDADFKGYIVLTCQEGCKIQYHPLCWKNVKDNFSNLDKLPDKDCLGKPCVTPDCKNAFNEPSVIHKIEIIGSDGNIKSQCMQDPAAENKQKEIAIRKRQRLKSDEHKTDKLPGKTKTRVKKINAPDRSQSSENIVTSMKPPAQKENKPIQTGGVSSVKSNIPEKNKETKLVEMNSTAAQKDFICTYFLMLLNTMGPLSKEKVEEEWEKFYPNCKPVSGLVSKSSGIFNLLKNSPYFVMLDNLLCIKESAESTPKEENEVTVNSNVTNTAVEERQPNLAKENAQLDSEIREIEKELSSNDVHVNSMNYNPIIPNMVPRSHLENIRKEIPMMEEEKPKNMMKEEKPKNMMIEERPQNMMIPNSLKNYSLGRPTSFGFFEDIKSDDKRYTVPIRESNKMNEYAYNKSMETNMVQEPMPTTYEEYLPLPPPIQWRDEGIESSLGFSFGDFDSAFKNMAIRPPRMKDVQSTYETRNRNREMSTQTEETGENKHSNDDESWMQHMQMAVNELIKKNKDLMKIRDDMMRDHENEVEALRNQIQTLRNSYEDYIKSLKESVNRNVDDDRRKMIALEQRMKIHEQILQSTKEELRKKDFDLLEAKRNLGTAMLERVERESNRQVQRLVTALASLPCNNQDADAVGRAMAKWEETGNRALKAKIDFWTACTTHQTKLYNGFGSDSLQELVIPVIEEPVGPCPLDNLTITLLQDKENSEANLPRPPTNAPPELPPFRNRTQSQPVPPIVPVQFLPPTVPIPVMSSPISAPLSPTSLGARPREPLGGTNGESGLHSWPSIPSIQNSTHSSSTGTARALSYFGKLMIELKRCYPSRSEDELCSAVKAVRRKNKYSLSGLTIERIVTMVGTVLEWWPEPTEGSMGLDKFMGWASDVVAPKDETFSSVSKVSKSTEWIMNSSNSLLEGEKEDCCICLQGMSEPKTELICLHSFHTQCIRQWLSKESVCPICRKFTRMPDEFPTLK